MIDKPQKQLPPWENDSLSSFLDHAAFNERVSSLKLPAVYALLKQVESTFQCVVTAIEKNDQGEDLIPCVLMMRSRSAFLAAVRLAMSGQAFEAMPVLRAAIEQAWYGLHLARDPRPPERITIWLKRDEGPEAKQKCKNEFTVSNVRHTHETLDAAGAKMLHELYAITIEYGAHPNEKGLLVSMRREEKVDAVTYQVGILHAEPLLIATTLKTAIEVAIGTLKVGQFTFPYQLKVEGLDRTIEQLIREVPRTFPVSSEA